MYILVNTIFKVTILLQPFLPQSSKKILHLLKQNREINYSSIENNIEDGIIIDTPEIIFPRVYRNDQHDNW